MPVLELAKCSYGLIIVLGAWNVLCDWLGWKIHLLQVRSGRELIISPKRVWRRLAQTFWASCRLSGWPWFLSEPLPRSSKVSLPKRVGALVSASVIALSPRRRRTRLSETPWPERRVWARVRAGWVFTSLLFYVWCAIDGAIVWWYVGYNMNVWEGVWVYEWQTWINPWHEMSMIWLVLKRHDNEMSWKSFMHGWFMMSWNELDLEHERHWF